MREAIAARGMTESEATETIFRASPTAMSSWLAGHKVPRAVYQMIALEWAGVPLEAWETTEQREYRLKIRALPSSVRSARAA